MEDKFIIFNGMVCSNYLNRMKDYAIRDLENETRKGKTNFTKFSKAAEKIYNDNKIECLKFLYSELEKIADGNRMMFSLPFSGCEELLKVCPDSFSGLRLPVLRREDQIIFFLKEDEDEKNGELKKELKAVLVKINEICGALKKEIEIYNRELADMLRKKSQELYEEMSARVN